MNFYKDVAPTIETIDGDKVNINDIVVNSKVIPGLVDNGRKNLLQNVTGSLPSTTRPTVTMNNDGTSFIISGKNNLSDAWFYRIGTVTFEPGTYVLSGNYFNTVSVILYNDIISGSNSWINRGTPVEYTFTESTTQTFYIRVDPGYDFGTGTTFEPMICTKEAWDVSHEYVPYKPDPFSTPISVLSESDLDTFQQGCVTTSPPVTVAGFVAGTWMVIRTYILNPAANRKMQIIETQYGDRKTRFYNGSSWGSWV